MRTTDIVKEKMSKIMQKGWVKKPALLYVKKGLSYNQISQIQKDFPVLPFLKRVEDGRVLFDGLLLLPERFGRKNPSELKLKSMKPDDLAKAKRLDFAFKEMKKARRYTGELWMKRTCKRYACKKYPRLKLGCGYNEKVEKLFGKEV